MGHLARLLTERATEPTETVAEPAVVKPEPADEFDAGNGPGKYSQADIDADPISDTDDLLERYGHDPEKVRLKDGFSVSRRELVDGRVVSTIRYELVERPQRADFDSLSARWRDDLLRPQPDQPAVVKPNTYVILIADPQLGKPGTDRAKRNWQSGVLAHIDTIRALQALGQSPEAVHIARMGDEGEGVCNNYTNQPYSVELNQSQQLELDFDLTVWTIREVAKLGLPISVSSVISNHGESWVRNATKDPVTSRYDNSSTFVARQAKKMFDEAEQFGGPHIEWTIGDNTPGVTVELSGESCYFSHMYVEKGRGASTELRTKNAVEKQILGDRPRFGSVRLFFAAHFHHYYALEFEGNTLFGCPALEAPEGSKDYMKDQYGVWSPPGMLGMQVGSAFTDRGWSSVNIF